MFLHKYWNCTEYSCPYELTDKLNIKILIQETEDEIGGVEWAENF